MRKFFDAVADAHFVPQDDGTVRFALPRPNAGFLVLNQAEADGVKILWRTLVRYYVYGCHACVLLSLIAPWTGFLLLPTLWIVAYCLVQEIRHRYNPQVGQDASQLDWVKCRLSRSISRRLALWLGWLATAVAVGLWYLLPLVYFESQLAAVFCLLFNAIRWSVFFLSLAANPKAKEYWAQAGKPQRALEAKN